MNKYPFVDTPEQATATATIVAKQAILDALHDAMIAQLKAGASAPLIIDIVKLNTAIDADVQQLAADTKQTVIHPITGQPISAKSLSDTPLEPVLSFP